MSTREWTPRERAIQKGAKRIMAHWAVSDSTPRREREEVWVEARALSRDLFDMADAVALSSHPDEETEWRAVGYFKDGTVHDIEQHGSLDRARTVRDARNAEEPRPNIFDGDDIEVRWIVESRSRPTPQDWSPWAPVPADREGA